MEDKQIIELFFSRSEEAISKLSEKYGTYCHQVARNVLRNESDIQECVNDTYLAVWNKIPPNRPEKLSVYLGKITRRIAIDTVRKQTAQRRRSNEFDLALDELNDCIGGGMQPDQAIEQKELSKVINSFLHSLPKTEQKVFVRRYFYLESIETVAKRFSFTESKVKSMLTRTRDKLKRYLEQEDML